MLRWIRVRNIAVIDELEVGFGKGLNLLTGETGAGKSILVDALGLALGARATTEILRTGASMAEVEAVFEMEPFPERLRTRLRDAGIEVEQDELVLRRELAATGRGRVAVNGCAAPTSLLREIGSFLADIHGQGEAVGFMDSETGLTLLDRLGGSESLRQNVAASHQRLRELERDERQLEQETRDRQSRQEILEFQLREIEAAHIRPHEDQDLEEERKLLIHEERLRNATEEAYQILYDEEDSVLSRLAQVWKRVAELAEIDSRLERHLETRSTVFSHLEDLALFLRDYRDRIRFTPGRLDEVESRLALLERLIKKYGGSLESVAAHREDCREALARLENRDELLGRVHRQMEDVAQEYLRTGMELSSIRVKTAEGLERRVEKELRGLAMEKARFSIQVRPIVSDISSRASWKESGLDDVELLFSANPGEELRSLGKIASGGESSRFMLALKSVASQGESPKTLVFDEVDAGIEGRVADVVGEKLKDLARTHQIVCITHLPQIASFADRHYRIEKAVHKGRTRTHVELLDHEGRVNEIARMLAGAVITASARRHAEQLVSKRT